MTTRTGRTGLKALVLAAGALAWLAAAAAAAAAAPSRMSFQGKLLDSANNPRNGNFDFTFRIYDQDVGGTERWVETQSQVDVVNGAFAVQLGAVEPLSTGLFTGASAYLEITVEPDPPMTPRQLLLASPFAFRAALADDLAPGNTSYIQVGTTLQPGSVFVVSSATIAGPLTVTKTSTFTATGSQTYSLVTSSGIRVMAGTLRVDGPGGVSAQTSVSASTLTASSGLILPQGTASFIEGSARWEPVQNLLFIGTGTANKTMADTDSFQTLRNKTMNASENVVIDATAIRGRSLSAAVPEEGMTLEWSAGASEWRPAYASAVTVVTVPFTPTRPQDNADLVANTIYLIPFFVPGTLRLNQIRFRIANGVAATGDAGLYDTSGNLVASGGTGAINYNSVGAAVMNISGAPKIIPPAQYFLAITSNGAPSLRGIDLTVDSVGVIKGLGTLSGGGATLPGSITISSIVDGSQTVFMSINE